MRRAAELLVYAGACGLGVVALAGFAAWLPWVWAWEQAENAWRGAAAR